MQAEREKLKESEKQTKAELDEAKTKLQDAKEKIRILEEDNEGDQGDVLKKLEAEYENCRKTLVTKEASINTNTQLIAEEDKRIQAQLKDIDKEKKKINGLLH